MKSTPIAVGCFLSAVFVAGCQMIGSPDSTHPYGNPVVVLVSVSESRHTTRELQPTAPYTLPEYPAPLLQGGEEGFVDVRLGIRPDGSVKDESILKSTDQDFDNSVLAAVKTWQFPQLKREGADATRNVDIVCRIRFTLEPYGRYSIGGEPGKSSGSHGEMKGDSPHSPTIAPR